MYENNAHSHLHFINPIIIFSCQRFVFKIGYFIYTLSLMEDRDKPEDHIAFACVMNVKPHSPPAISFF